MLLEKQPLSIEELEAQTAFELPERDMTLVTVVITNLLNNNTVTVTLRNIDVAVQLCANVIGTGNFDCDIQQ